MEQKELVIIGGGPAGMAAALSAYEEGVRDILILEREHQLGGILEQCIHNGFGLHRFKEELTGPEYAARFSSQVISKQIPYLLDTMVLDLETAADGNKIITAVSPEKGYLKIAARAVVLAMGCRERPRGALNIAGTRPAGIYTAGAAQKFVNRKGEMPGKRVVILGSGDIGLIMARRMTLEGAKVEAVCELMPYSGGLTRNIVQCLDDFGIPLKLSHTVVRIHGKERVEGVTIAAVGADRRPIPGTEEYIACDTLLLSVGLIPENELSQQAGVELDPVTSGAVVDECRQTSIPGVFACGNVLHVHDLVDYVSEEAEIAGRYAAHYLQKGNLDGETVPVTGKDGVRYVVPQKIHRNAEPFAVYFRVGDVYRDVQIAVECDGKVLLTRKKQKVAPGEMETIPLKAEQIAQISGPVTVRLIRKGEN
ncbi:MAG: NAD(P)/FAD-dependent oxidoreductase [Candidatus Merdivicinus sp.]|jgi:NADPH-dependent 2,4-dienoyl-CoA reductase/sulfur reductase-like enzyme